MSHSGPQAVMFDMDGLLIDSEPLWYEAEKAVMARLGGPWGTDDQQALLGGSMPTTVRYLLSKGTRQVEPGVVARWLTDIMVGLLASRPLPALPGAVELAAEVAAAGLPLALVTSSEPEVVNAVLPRLGFTFPVVVCGGDVSVAKPDPEGYLLAAAKLGVDPRCCMALEDSLNGLGAAEAAGYLTVAVPSLAAIPDRPGRVVVGSLRGVTLDDLIRMWREADRARDGAGVPADMCDNDN